MRYRTSYGQTFSSTRKKCLVVGIIAAELKSTCSSPKRGALLHDIGKVLTHEHDGTHVQLGVEVATKHGEHPTVINCIAAHHDDVAHESPISVSCSGGCRVRVATGGAPRGVRDHVKRLTQLNR